MWEKKKKMRTKLFGKPLKHFIRKTQIHFINCTPRNNHSINSKYPSLSILIA